MTNRILLKEIFHHSYIEFSGYTINDIKILVDKIYKYVPDIGYSSMTNKNINLQTISQNIKNYDEDNINIGYFETKLDNQYIRTGSLERFNCIYHLKKISFQNALIILDYLYNDDNQDLSILINKLYD